MKKYVEYTSKDILRSLSNTPQVVLEVTDTCNLNCKYCGYGEFYDDYDARTNKMLDINRAVKLIDYLNELWSSDCNQSNLQNVYISFYGGEPLLNMPFIRKVVDHVKGMHSPYRTLVFSMTTNAILLDRYMDYLVENHFNLLVSLDGNEHNHSYRVDIKGNSSFKRVVRNVDVLKARYPLYFEDNVNFNSVLHNRNSVDDIYTFIKGRYGKIPSIGELNSMGIKPDMQEQFAKTYRNSNESLLQSENYEKIERNMFLKTSSSQQFSTFIRQHSGFVFSTYKDLLFDRSDDPKLPTGTCIPFGKKIFVTVNGKILPCERIGHQFALGEIGEDGIKLDFEKIAQRYNCYFNKLKKQCSSCYNRKACIQCIFNLKDLDGKPVCHGFMSAKDFEQYKKNNTYYMQKFPEDYYKVLREVEVE